MSKVAVIQLSSRANVEHNLNRIEHMTAMAAAQGAQLVLLPENFAFMGQQERDKLSIAETEGQGKIQDSIRNLARQHQIWIIAGTIPLRCNQPEKVFASSIVYNDKGEQCARYDKIHLFDVRVNAQEVHCESATIAAGDRLVIVDTPVGRVGLSVCYDLRFAELYRGLLEKGAEIFSVPAAFTATTGPVHWEILLRARAIENLCYVMAANQCGIHDNGRKTWGHSMVVEPWGKAIASTTEIESVITAEIDRRKLSQIREQFPCNQHHVLK
ncbi:MAG: carbon-nitrogen hydrolase family protein [Legionellaceae bacterium]|nr:carbon-nitrogen hydrolase family protein [Legionellaceae bacterium]